MAGKDEDQESFAELFIASQIISHALGVVSRRSDPLFRHFALKKLFALAEEFKQLAAGKLVFTSTESWREAYEWILACDSVKHYRSVAWVRTEDYWQDIPGRRSMQRNFDLRQKGLSIERILILPDFYWPAGSPLPSNNLCGWIEEQHRQGITLMLLRETDLDGEPDLIADFGIYGDRAWGLWELDDQCRTVRYTLDFAPQSYRQALERWKRLLFYSIPYADLLSPNPSRRHS
ncbi:MAG: hypothetical protein IT426_21160 [Pirellulales bacterium]|nr:hypothetical protein [Pirellulales bacterium]